MMQTSSCIDRMRLKDTAFLVSRDEGFAPFPFATGFGEGFGCRTLSSVSFSNCGRDRFFFFVATQEISSSLWEPTDEKENSYSSESASSLWAIAGGSPASLRGACACAPVVGFASQIRCVFFKIFKNVATFCKMLTKND
jgi:hypothetical protein